MLFDHNKPRKNGHSRTEDLLASLALLEQDAAEICFRRNAIITHTERRGVMDALALSHLARYGVSALGKERAAQIARNLELSGTCPGLADFILSL